MADEPQPTEPPKESAEREPLLKRAADAWKRRTPAWKVGAIGVMAAAATAGAVAYARAKAADDDGEPGILPKVVRILEEAAAAQQDTAGTFSPSDASPKPSSTGEASEQPDGSDDASSPPQPRRGGPVSSHTRNQCYNPRGHATGNCTHKEVQITDHVRKGGKKEQDAEV
ncbi:hypothetical protein EES37_37765 [Streptomyces sp. ADI91-18]|uniref:hypothetical protein n=1 Tax=Streptomyces sp. ADI91-18 TaxID=1522755 RepID=UPI000F5548BE|nr:hypothetical protein [Streptomyces sp. ADI91-18]RPK23976.1 hypothetical protein EES37_37765 [Streptomyces sp. ADI91-18]